MIHQMFSIHDDKALAFIPPFTFPTREMAVRSFTECVNEKGHMFNKHPFDFTLFNIAVFDDVTATVEPHLVIVNLGNASQYKIREE